MAGDWSTRTIDELKAKSPAAIAIGPFGSRMKSKCYVPSGVPVIQGNNISDTRELTGEMVFITPEKAEEVKSSIIFADDLFFPHRGSIGLVGIVPRKGAARYVQSSSFMKLTCDRNLVEPLYLFYFFRSAQGRHELLKNASTVGTPGIGQPLSSLKAIRVPCPPLAEQKAIAHILGTLDDKIELNRRMNETLEAMARAIFRSWFVDFDPVRAKMDGRKPEGMDAATAKLFPDEFEESELGPIPRGWQAGTLAQCADLNPEAWTKDTTPDEIKYVDLSNTKWGRIEAMQRFSRSGAPSRAQRVLRPGDTIVGTVRPGNGSYCLVSEEGLTGSTGFAVLRPRKPVNKAYLYLVSTASDNIERLSHLADGGAYPAVRPEVVLATDTLQPGEAVMHSFATATEPLLNRIAVNEQESRSLATLRDTLLPKLLSGELHLVLPGIEHD